MSARTWRNYGELFSGLGWLPLVGPWIERGRIANKLLAKLLQRRKEGSADRRAKLTKELQKLGRPIVVVIDDIDRLSTTEIRDIFKLVRLTASFPNIVYVLAFDRERVENALTEQGIEGRDYLAGYGSVEILDERVDALNVAEDSEDADLLALARKYRGGWRPKDFGANNDEE